MPKIKAPSTPASEVTVGAPATDTPAIDISPLIASLTPLLGEAMEADARKDGAIIDIAIECRNFRSLNSTLERNSVKLAIQTAISESYALKLEDVQNKPDKASPNARPEALEKLRKRESAYVLASTLLSIAWPKNEEQDAKVSKLLKAGEKRFVVLKKAAAKQHLNPRERESTQITEENFATKFFEFLSRAQSDMGVPMKDILAMAEAHIPEMQKALAEPSAPTTVTA